VAHPTSTSSLERLPLCDKWVPQTRLGVIPDKWVQSTRRPADQSVGLADLTCGYKDEKTAWRANQGNPDGLR
jgi:hypothetical protein